MIYCRPDCASQWNLGVTIPHNSQKVQNKTGNQQEKSDYHRH